MGMRMVTNPAVLEARLTQIGDKAVKGMSERMRRVAIRVRDLAREYAPVKTGLLERSIDYRVVRDGRRNAFVVFVDLDAIKYASRGRVVELGDYAFLMEENLRPYGRGARFNLGPGSRRKAASGKKVGGRFLARAVRDGLQDVLGEMAEEVRRATNSRGASSVGVRNRRPSNEEDDE